MLRMTPIASAVLLLLLGIDAHAAEETFDTNFMMGGMKGERVSDFRLDDNQPLPGQYDIDIYVNKQWRGKYDITIKDNPDDTCLSRDALTRLGINIQALDKQNECPTLKQAVQGGSYASNIGTFRLDLSVPQAFVDELEQGMFLRKTGIVALMPSIPRTMPASITATIRILATVKVPTRVSPAG